MVKVLFSTIYQLINTLPTSIWATTIWNRHFQTQPFWGLHKMRNLLQKLATKQLTPKKNVKIIKICYALGQLSLDATSATFFCFWVWPWPIRAAAAAAWKAERRDTRTSTSYAASHSRIIAKERTGQWRFRRSEQMLENAVTTGAKLFFVCCECAWKFPAGQGQEYDHLRPNVRKVPLSICTPSSHQATVKTSFICMAKLR